MNDPISDLLTRLRNANHALLNEVVVSHSRMKESIADILKREGYITDYSVEGDKLKQLKLKLKYQGRQGVIAGLKRVSSPGLRRYVGATEIPPRAQWHGHRHRLHSPRSDDRQRGPKTKCRRRTGRLCLVRNHFICHVSVKCRLSSLLPLRWR